MNIGTNQALNECLKLLLSFRNSFLCTDDCDQLLILIFSSREDDPGACAVPYFADICTSFSDKELVVFRFGTKLNCVAFSLLLNNKLIKVHYIVLRATTTGLVLKAVWILVLTKPVPK